MVAESWTALSPLSKGRLDFMRPLMLKMFGRGLRVHVLDPGVTDVSDAGYPWGGPAVYVPWLRTLAMTEAIAYGPSGYGTYRGDIHEAGHAFWYLMLSSNDRWQALYPMWRRAVADRRLLDEYSGTKAEEWWAQAWEAYWTREDDESGINWNRQDLMAADRGLYDWIRSRVAADGADPEAYA